MGTHRTPNKIPSTMSVDVYTQNIGLTQKAKFWSTYISALKGVEELRVIEEGPHTRTWYPSITETIPEEYPSLKNEFSKLENQILTRPVSRTGPLTPVLPDARDRIFSGGYSYVPVHSQVYGTFRAKTARCS